MKTSSLKLVPSPAVVRPTPVPGARRTSPARLGVVEQVRAAARPENRLAACAGLLLGGFVPFATYCVAHLEYVGAVAWYAQIATLLVLGGLVYSATTVYGWGRLAFGLPLKAAGFVILLEGVMTFSTTTWLGFVALAYLMIINGIATATRLANGR